MQRTRERKRERNLKLFIIEKRVEGRGWHPLIFKFGISVGQLSLQLLRRC